MDIIEQLKINLYEKYPEEKGCFETLNFQYGKVIFKKRNELGLTQKQLADKCQLPKETFVIAETGLNNLPIDIYRQIFDYLKVDYPELSKSIIENGRADRELLATI